MKNLGFYWNAGLEVVEIDGKAICLNGWNGEHYNDCFEVCDNFRNKWYEIVGETRYTATPIYEEQVDADGDVEYIIVDFSLTENFD